MNMTRSVRAGGLYIGGGASVSVQSMTNTDTADAAATVAQIKRLERAGCDIVRASVYNRECVAAIPEIKKSIAIPLVADIHFDYRLAIAAIEAGVDKLRFNPGNIGGESRVFELARAAASNGVPVRIGVNGGSLERELLKKYGGATPEAMVESALNHAALLERAGFYDMVISVKASDVKTTVASYRLLSKKTDYPLHIGVTEAGAGEHALVKSAAGIGALLLDGIGDTIRVSITGDPVQEVEAGLMILSAVGLRKCGAEIISCPTCGRTSLELLAVVERVRSSLPTKGRCIKVAVMGCVVNGPGEASAADIGIAFAPGGAVVFKRGERFASGGREEMIALLIDEARAMQG